MNSKHLLNIASLKVFNTTGEYFKTMSLVIIVLLFCSYDQQSMKESNLIFRGVFTFNLLPLTKQLPFSVEKYLFEELCCLLASHDAITLF